MGIGLKIEVDELLTVFDHILPDEKQHWVSPTYICHVVDGEPKILEAEKCSAIGWFAVDQLPSPLSMVSPFPTMTGLSKHRGGDVLAEPMLRRQLRSSRDLVAVQPDEAARL